MICVPNLILDMEAREALNFWNIPLGCYEIANTKATFLFDTSNNITWYERYQ